MTNAKHSSLSIFTYKDYRAYLKDVFDDLKSKNRKISLEYIARKIGISKSYLRYVLLQKRHLTLDLVSFFAKAFGLKKREQQALIYMICRDTCQDKEVKTFFNSIISNLSDFSVHQLMIENVDTKDNNTLFFDSLAMVIHSLAKRKDFRPSVEWIKEQLTDSTISKENIQFVLESLLNSNSIVQNIGGQWAPQAFVFNSPSSNQLEGYKIYKVGLQAMMKVTEDVQKYKPASFHMMSLSYDDENIDRIVDVMRESRDSLIKISQETKDPSYVIFISQSAACMAKRKKE